MSAQENIILNTKESTSDFNHQGTAHLDYFANRLHVHPVDRSNSKGRKMHEIWSRSTNGHEKEIIKISGLLLQQMFLHKCASRESFNSAGGDDFQSNRWSNLGAGSRNAPAVESATVPVREIRAMRQLCARIGPGVHRQTTSVWTRNVRISALRSCDLPDKQKKSPIGFDSMHGDVWKAARAFEGE
ncbi:uncharacterized protein K444DRAFT_612577 [Hyaloscypha bicolor E]|uniref:Uncharacterized protein n=1 Tax=Hyaloscypha bicolor E TaxID=1095630 RepID=A0A2J6TBK4_9HELO|nr:uncharacterized protein K444DRAFT_612577 [Hyaloscypha bicolor E]PMD60409.1 hypothetical protein K444DRAFT_612577 [Hyaloscypha bicolor E]